MYILSKYQLQSFINHFQDYDIIHLTIKTFLTKQLHISWVTEY